MITLVLKIVLYMFYKNGCPWLGLYLYKKSQKCGMAVIADTSARNVALTPDSIQLNDA